MSTEPTFSARVADEVRAMIYRRNLNKSELARRLGVSHTWVTNRLAGHQQIGLDELERIAVALEVDITTLLPATDRADGGGAGVKKRYASRAGRASETLPDRAISAVACPTPDRRPADAPAGRTGQTGRAGRRPTIKSWMHA